MKRELHFACLCKHLLVLVFVLLSSTTSAFAGEESYYDFFVNLTAYPSGAGKVYAEVDKDNNIIEDQNGNPFSPEMGVPAENVEVKFMYKYGDTAYFNAYAVPTDGWILAGFSGCKIDVQTGDHLFNDSIVSRDNPANLSIISHFSDKDQGVAESSFPLVADSTLYALFTHIATNVCVGQDSLGTVEISKVCNNIGEEVTLTAKVRDAEHTHFDYWIKKETGEKITSNPLKLTVNECAHYEAHFTSSLAETINFPEEGGLAIFYSNNDVCVPTNVKVLTFNYSENYDSVEYNKEKNMFFQVPDTSGYHAYAQEPYIVLGKGEATFFKTGEEVNAYSNSYFKWSGEGVKVAELAATCHYYGINLEKQQFELLADDATIPANTAYWALPNERYEAHKVSSAPSAIYWNDPETTGISTITKENNTKVANKGIYNLQGQKVNKMTGKGLYIINGKKVINLAK